MKPEYTLSVAIVAAAVVIAVFIYIVQPPKSTSLEQACLDSGGTVTTALCCKSVDDFPNTCLIGACGCEAGESHEVQTCDCGDGCWDGEKCVSGEVTDFESCAAAGNPVMESYPRQCNADGQTFTEEACSDSEGDILTLADAKEIAEEVCGALKETYVCNEVTGTYWLDLDLERENCSPACVVNLATREAEINWRCTGLVPE